MRTVPALALSVALALSACSSDDDGGGGPNDAAAASSTTTSGPAAAFFGDFDTVIELRTPTEGEGLRPTLRWVAVDGADLYGVYLYDPDGAVYWTWRGEGTEVPVGGSPRLDDDAPGPRVTPGMTWAVVAWDADLLPVAASAERPIGP